jgi:hypothetical protein
MFFLLMVNNTTTEINQQTLELFFGDALDRLRGYGWMWTPHDRNWAMYLK